MRFVCLPYCTTVQAAHLSNSYDTISTLNLTVVSQVIQFFLLLWSTDNLKHKLISDSVNVTQKETKFNIITIYLVDLKLSGTKILSILILKKCSLIFFENWVIYDFFFFSWKRTRSLDFLFTIVKECSINDFLEPHRKEHSNLGFHVSEKNSWELSMLLPSLYMQL